MELCYRFGFDAAHRFENYPDGHPYRGVHGHSFQVEVAVSGKPDAATGFVTDFGDIEKACAQVRAALDHRMLNEIQGLERPSLENLSVWIWNQPRAAAALARARHRAARFHRPELHLHRQRLNQTLGRDAASPRSHISPAISRSASRATGASMCSLGACWLQDA